MFHLNQEEYFLMSKPLYMWAGGKKKMIKYYRPIFPSRLILPIDSYVEPFFGGGAMFIHIMEQYRPKDVHINDINADIMSIYRCVRDDYDNFLKRVIYLEQQYLPKSKEDRRKFYNDTRHDHAFSYKNWSKTEESATLYFLMKTGFNGIYQINQNTGGRYGTPPGLMNQKDKVFDRDIVKWWNHVLQGVHITSGDWKSNTRDTKDAFYFFDPPYRSSFADYGNKFGDDELIELIEFANSKDKSFVCNRDSGDGWFEKHKMGMTIEKFDITYTAGRRKKETVKDEKGKDKDIYHAKKAKEVLLWNMR